MNPTSQTPSPRTPRRRPFLAVMPLAMATLVGLVGIPVRPAPAAPRAGTLHQEIVSLTGSDAIKTVAVAPSSRASRREPRPAPMQAATGWSAEVPVDAGTQSFGVSWSGAARGSVAVRGMAATGWTEWSVLTADPTDGPDPDSTSPRDRKSVV